MILILTPPQQRRHPLRIFIEHAEVIISPNPAREAVEPNLYRIEHVTSLLHIPAKLRERRRRSTARGGAFGE